MQLAADARPGAFLVRGRTAGDFFDKRVDLSAGVGYPNLTIVDYFVCTAMI